MREDRRDSYRFKVNKDQVEVKDPPDYSGDLIKDISASGASFFVPNGRIFDLKKDWIVLKFADYPCLETRITPIWAAEKGGIFKAGFRFQEMDQETLGILSRFLIDNFLEENQKLSKGYPGDGVSIEKGNKRVICELFKYHCLFRHQPLLIYSGDLLLPVTLQVEELLNDESRSLIKIAINGGKEDIIETGKEYIFSFPGSNAINFFKAKVFRAELNFLMITLPFFIQQRGFRDSLRISPDPDHVNLVIKHSRLPGVYLKKSVLDIGAKGFSFPFDPERDLLFPGEHINDVTLNLPEGPVRVEGVIRSIHTHLDKMAYGFEILQFICHKEKEIWMRYVLLATHERLKIGKKEDTLIFWEVLKNSNYIGKEVTPSLRPVLKKRFFEAWGKHPEHSRINQNLILFQKEKPVATVSMNLLYPKTSLGHHLSIDRRIRKNIFDVGRELVSGFLYILRHLIHTEYFLSYFHADKTWNDLLYGRFLGSYPRCEDFVYDRYHLHKCLLYPEKVGSQMVMRGVDIVPSNPMLLQMLSQYLRGNLHEREFEAYSYNEDEITLEDFSRRCLHYNYERKRRIFFAMVAGKPLAALIAETGDEGVNTFNLLNCCRIVFLTQEAKQDDMLLAQLMAQAIRFFTDEKKQEFIFFGEYDGKPKQILEKCGVKYVTDGMRWLGSSKMLPAYINYIEETLGMLSANFKPY